MYLLHVNVHVGQQIPSQAQDSGLRSRCQWSIATVRCIQYNKLLQILTNSRDLAHMA